MNDERHPGPMWMTVDGFTDTACGYFVRHDRCMMIVLAMVAGAAADVGGGSGATGIVAVASIVVAAAADNRTTGTSTDKRCNRIRNWWIIFCCFHGSIDNVWPGSTCGNLWDE